jgi:hypothetical protein
MARRITNRSGWKENKKRPVPVKTEAFTTVTDIHSGVLNSMSPTFSSAYPTLKTLKNYEAHIEQQRAEAVAFVLGRRITTC